jgi:saccharopine dehydrogenase-like NADP-dependent oxidoreductase
VRPLRPRSVDLKNTDGLKDILKDQDAVLSCLPYHLNIGVSTVAHALGLHYFDLTEDVPTTKHIRELSKTSKGIMAPQCGLAPGFVGIVGARILPSSSKRSAPSVCASGRVAAKPDGPAWLCVQLVTGRRGERVSQ